MGSRFRADESKPAKPTKKIGCSGKGWERGSTMALGASNVSKLPVKKLDLRSAMGTTGKRKMAFPEAWTVKWMPATMRASDRSMAETGPLKAKSKSAERFSGNDRRGVMQPQDPS
jgi:hypothetical protein